MNVCLLSGFFLSLIFKCFIFLFWFSFILFEVILFFLAVVFVFCLWWSFSNRYFCPESKMIVSCKQKVHSSEERKLLQSKKFTRLMNLYYAIRSDLLIWRMQTMTKPKNAFNQCKLTDIAKKVLYLTTINYDITKNPLKN